VIAVKKRRQEKVERKKREKSYLSEGYISWEGIKYARERRSGEHLPRTKPKKKSQKREKKKCLWIQAIYQQKGEASAIKRSARKEDRVDKGKRDGRSDAPKY